jgi:hypothetical protein
MQKKEESSNASFAEGGTIKGLLPGDDVLVQEHGHCRVLSIHAPSGLLLVYQVNQLMHRFIVSARNVTKCPMLNYPYIAQQRREHHPYFHHPFYPSSNSSSNGSRSPGAIIMMTAKKREEEEEDLSYLVQMDPLFSFDEAAQEEPPPQDELKLFEEDDPNPIDAYKWIVEECAELINDYYKDEEEDFVYLNNNGDAVARNEGQ